MNALLTAIQLSRWSDELATRGLLPRLVRRLILATADCITHIHFPADEGVGRPGYDGTLEVPASTDFIPSGRSVWEMGVGRDPAKKAADDYRTRTTDPAPEDPANTAFVFVTPRPWPEKADWVVRRKAEAKWADVRVYDADDLELWLSEAPPVAAWLCRLIHRLPDGCHDLGEVWEGWAGRTNPPVIPALLLAGRAESAAQVRSWLTGPSATLAVRSDSADDVFGFLAAVVENLPELERERTLARTLLLDTPDSWRAASGVRTPLILLAPAAVAKAPVAAVARGHKVLLAFGADAAGVAVDVELAHLRRTELERTLTEMGVPASRAGEIAEESRGHLAAVVELVGGVIPGIPPPWADPAHAPALVPLLLAGAWDAGASPADADAVRTLARPPDGDLDRLLTRWENGIDPPLRRIGRVWEWVARRRAWPHMARFLTPADLAAFRATVVAVLGDPDPALDLPPDNRWAAAVFGHHPRYSDRFRDGLVGGLALMAVGADKAPPALGLSVFVRGVVRDVFGEAPCPSRWQVLARFLPPLAEAAPDEFLEAVERDVLGRPAVAAALFEEEQPFGLGRQCHLLWALEALAWHPDYLSAATAILAGLAATDPGGRATNRPAASLRAIYLPWRPQTTADVHARFTAIDAAARGHEGVMFELCRQLLPRGFDTATPTARPRWRAWVPSDCGENNRSDCRDARRFAFDRVLGWARNEPARWAALFDPLPELDEEHMERLVDGLARQEFDRVPPAMTEGLRSAVRQILHWRNTQQHFDATITSETAARLEEVYRKLEPSDLVARHAWLFGPCPAVLSARGDDMEAEHGAVAAEQKAAVRDLLAAGGVAAVVRVAAQAKNPFLPGWYAGLSDVPDAELVDTLAGWLDATPESVRACARGAVAGRLKRSGWQWIDWLFNEGTGVGWPGHRRGRFACGLPFVPDTWDRVEGWGEDAAAAYWQEAAAWSVEVPDRDGPRAVRVLLAHGRMFTAVQLAGFCRDQRGRAGIAAEVVLEVLQVAATGVTPTDQPNRGGGFAHTVGNLFDAVEKAEVADEVELARLEWLWFPVLDGSRRKWKALGRVLARDASLFGMLVAYAHPPLRDDSSVGEGSISQAALPDPAVSERARRILNEWTGFPGRQCGNIVAAELIAWVNGVRDACRATGLTAAGERRAGEVLARAPGGSDGAWPHEAVREVIEVTASDDLERGLFLGVVNRQGWTNRSHDAGGEVEWDLADRHSRDASAVAASAPRTSRVLRKLAGCFSHDATWHDTQRDLDEFR